MAQASPKGQSTVCNILLHRVARRRARRQTVPPSCQCTITKLIDHGGEARTYARNRFHVSHHGFEQLASCLRPLFELLAVGLGLQIYKASGVKDLSLEFLALELPHIRRHPLRP